MHTHHDEGNKPLRCVCTFFVRDYKVKNNRQMKKIKTPITYYGWHIHAVERNVTAGKAANRRKQIEWMVVNYSI